MERDKTVATLPVLCTSCQRMFLIGVKIDDYQAWKAGKHAQDAFPYLSPDERELIMSGTCGECFDKLFAEEEEENRLMDAKDMREESKKGEDE